MNNQYRLLDNFLHLYTIFYRINNADITTTTTYYHNEEENKIQRVAEEMEAKEEDKRLP